MPIPRLDAVLERVAIAIVVSTALAGCLDTSTTPDKTSLLQEKVSTVVIIYAENRSFDGLFGNFPGARGLGDVMSPEGTPTAAYVPQKDRDGTTVLPKLPQTWNGVTAAGNVSVVTQAM